MPALDCSIQTAVKNFLSQQPQANYLLAYSGGLDSHVLLHALAQQTMQLRAMHIHHGLNKQADAWQDHCDSVCHALSVPFMTAKVHIERQPQHSLEAQARQHRYDALAAALAPNDILLTAHTQSDQAETVLLQLMRGAGVAGLAAMPSCKPFHRGYHARPLLSLSRQQLAAYAKTHQLSWIEDDSNSDECFNRNYMRHRILPVLQQRWPAVLNSTARSARHCADALELSNDLATLDLNSVKAHDPCQLNVNALRLLSPARQRNVLRFWVRKFNFPVPYEKQLQAIQQQMLTAAEDKTPCVHWANVEIRRYQQAIYLMPKLPAHDVSLRIAWDLKSPLMLPNNLGQLTAAEPGHHPVSVRFRQGGERCRPQGRQTHHLRKLMQEWRIPPWQRDRVPLIYQDDVLQAVVGYCVCEGATIQVNSKK